MCRRIMLSCAIIGSALALTLLLAPAAVGQEDGDVALTVQIQSESGTTTLTAAAKVEDGSSFFSEPVAWSEGATTHSTTVSGYLERGPDGKLIALVDVLDSGECAPAAAGEPSW